VTRSLGSEDYSGLPSAGAPGCAPHATVVIVEDEPITRRSLVGQFEAAGYRTRTLDDGAELIGQVDAESASLVLLDIGLPGDDGLTLTRRLRAASEVGIILVTGRSERGDLLAGLEAGADDYVTKPVDGDELLGRARNLVRRVNAQREDRPGPDVLRFEGFNFDRTQRTLTRDGEAPQLLTAGEFQLLDALVSDAGVALSRDRIMTRMRNRRWHPDDRYIDVMVGQLRRKLGERGSRARIIRTVHGVGYLFAATVSQGPAP